MALYDLQRSSALPLSTVIATRIASLVLAAIDRLPTPRARPQNALLRMSDRELADLGLSRVDLERLQ